MNQLKYRPFPRRYALKWDEENRKIIIAIHKDFLEALYYYLKKNEATLSTVLLIEGLQKTLELGAFTSEDQEQFGFNNLIQKQGIADDFEEWGIAIPNCCTGEGDFREINWQEVYTMSANFCVIFTLLSAISDFKTFSEKLQLFMVETMISKDQFYGARTWGEISFPLRHYLQINENASFVEVEKATQIVFYQMFGKNNSFNSFFSFRVYDEGRFSLEVPGNASDIGVYGHERFGPLEGCRFSCHNLDSPIQQVAILAGLAALHDKADKEIK